MRRHRRYAGILWILPALLGMAFGVRGEDAPKEQKKTAEARQGFEGILYGFPRTGNGDATSRPLKDFEFEIVPGDLMDYDQPEDAKGRIVKTDKDGRFKVELEPGSYTIFVEGKRRANIHVNKGEWEKRTLNTRVSGF
ncbi:MAG: prealbumin-like fold domain-containing protein [Planctomycetota bacterium]|nr:prealbumin-like fold domain-containing protein [Planctomycetota bacterium]